MFKKNAYFERFFSWMLPYMSAQNAWRRERFAAIHTLIWALSTVNLHNLIYLF